MSTSTSIEEDNLERLTTCFKEISNLNESEHEESFTSCNNSNNRLELEALENENDDTNSLHSSVSQDDDYRRNADWLAKSKHIFVLSSSGKPIYSRYGNENKLATLFGVMQAIVSFVQDQKDTLKCIQAGNTKFVFMIKSHLILVAVAKTSRTNQVQTEESFEQISQQLNYVFNQIISILTMTTLNKTYEKRRNFDLRRSLSGVERLIDHLLDFYEKEAAFTFGAVQCLPLPPSTRDMIGSAIIQSCNKIKNLVFAILLANDRLVSLVRMKKYSVHPADLHLIMNLVHASESLKSAESWTPLCLPHFNEDGYLYSHVSYLAEDCQACLLLLTTERDVFFQLSDAKQKIVEKLRRNNCLEAINEALVQVPESSATSGFPEIRHYVYKIKSSNQFFQPAVAPPYNLHPDRLLALYRRTQQLLTCAGRPMKLVFEKTPDEAILAWDTKEFDLFLVFEPLIDTSTAIATVSRLLNWLKKREDRVFQMNQQLF